MWFRQVAVGSWDSLAQEIFFLHVLLQGWSSSVRPATGSLMFRSLRHCWADLIFNLTVGAFQICVMYFIFYFL